MLRGSARSAQTLKTTRCAPPSFPQIIQAILIWQVPAMVNIEQPQRPAPCIGTIAVNDEIAIGAKLPAHFDDNDGRGHAVTGQIELSDDDEAFVFGESETR
ncbi:MAG TPA: hypothetical protein VK561_13480 [Bradyrhizobium sp.]|jgi:hypothetical protein|nr:hypothetical protein [Bradyrhizobium sp.]